MSFNAAIAERFELTAKLLELLGENVFRVNAHKNVARTIADYPSDLSTIATQPGAKAALEAIPGIGPKIADKIIEFASTGKIDELETLKTKVPAGLIPLLDVPGLGPKTIAMLWKDAKVESVADLKAIIADGSILKLPRMGAKSVEKISQSLSFAEQGSQRLALGIARRIADVIITRLKKIKGVDEAIAAGSLRRGRDTVGDLDILVATTDPAAVSEAFRTMPEVRAVLASGENRSSVRLATKIDLGRWGSDEEAAAGADPTIQVDLRVIPKASFGAALLYFTGSKEHNVFMRELAQRRELTLNEYGLFPEDHESTPPQQRGIKPIASKTEAEIYKALKLSYAEPEIREGSRWSEQESPKLIELSDIKAELHAHTTASDGEMSILQLAQAAKDRGFHTIAVTDHSRSSVIANGLSDQRLREHITAIREAQKKIKGITILAGSEVDILADGSLDYDDDLLAQLDIVVASPHVALSQDPKTATKRLIKAIQHPSVRILGHPTGRLINRRAGLSPDMHELIAAAKEHHVALEINAHWMRLDLRDTQVHQAVLAGALIAIDCDVHALSDFDNLPFGITTARRGWLTPESCINTWPAKKLHTWLARV